MLLSPTQGGIEKGIYKQEDVENYMNICFQQLGIAGCPSIDGLYYSASSPKKDMFAKPNTGMFKRCEQEVKHVKFNKGYFVGDILIWINDKDYIRNLGKVKMGAKSYIRLLSYTCVGVEKLMQC